MSILVNFSWHTITKLHVFSCITDIFDTSVSREKFARHNVHIIFVSFTSVSGDIRWYLFLSNHHGKFTVPCVVWRFQFSLYKSQNFCKTEDLFTLRASSVLRTEHEIFCRESLNFCNKNQNSPFKWTPMEFMICTLLCKLNVLKVSLNVWY